MTIVAHHGLETAFQGPERYMLPTIVDMHHADPSQFGITSDLAPVSIETFEVTDPYISAIPEYRVAEITGQQAAANDEAAARRREGHWDRRPGTAYQDASGAVAVKGRREWGDPVASEHFFGTPGAANELDPGLTVWKGLVPDAEALKFISDPTGFAAITGRRGIEVPFSREAQEWMAVCDDGRGIRNRGALMAKSVQEYVKWYRWAHPEATDAQITMLSVACGTALPTMQGAMHANTPGATLILVDSNSRSMSGAGRLAEEVGFEGRLITDKRDIFDPQALAKLKDDLMQGGVDRRPLIVDAMGIFEYTSRELLAPGQDDNGSLLYNPVEFLRSVHELVRPGGRLIFGQMRDDRPNADFTMGVVQWPYVCMRSPKEVMQIIKDAGIEPKWVTLGLTPDGLYTVASIDKPGEVVQPPVATRRSRRSERRNTGPQPSRPRELGRGVMSALRNRARDAAASFVLRIS